MPSFERALLERAPKPALEQSNSMKAKLREGRESCLRQGIPEWAIVYVVRNNKDDEDPFSDYDRMGSCFQSIEDAASVCHSVVECSFLYTYDLFHILVVDGRKRSELVDLLIDVGKDTAEELADRIAARAMEELRI